MNLRTSKTYALFFLGFLVFLLVLGRTKLLQDPDTLWHIEVGRQILSQGRLPDVDSFTFTFAGQNWIANQWMAECAFACVAAVSGFPGLVFVSALLLAGLYAWLAGRLVASGLHWLVAVLVLALVFATSAYNLHVRPHLATMVCQAILFGLLTSFERGGISVARLWWLIPLVILWTNLHGGVLGGLATLGLAAAGWTVWKTLGWKSPLVDRRSLVSVWSLLACCFVCTLVNPYGLAMHWAWIAILQGNLPQLVIEHAPLDVTSPQGQMVLVLALVFAGFFVGTRWQVPRVTWLLVIVWFCLALTRIRHAPLFAIAAAVVLADLIPQSRAALWLGSRKLFTSPPDNGQSTRTLGATGLLVLSTAGLAFAALALHWWGPSSDSDRALVRPHRSIWPSEHLAVLREYESSPLGTRIFNEQEFGGFLIYRTPGYRVFIDGRCELFGEAFLKSYLEARSDPQIIRNWEHEFGFRLALVKAGSPFDHYFAEADDWESLQESPTASFYVKTGE